MGFVLKDYRCECGNNYEDLVERDGPLTVPCDKCGASNTPVWSPPHIAAFSIKSKEAQVEHLKKRSSDHTRKHIHGHK